MTAIVRPAECHPDRPWHARGLCRACYNGAYWRGSLPEPKAARERKAAACHPDRPHAGLGLCGPCYQEQRTRTAEQVERRRPLSDWLRLSRSSTEGPTQ